MLTLIEKLTKIELIKANPDFTNVWFDKNLLEDDREDSCWYGGIVCEMTYKNRFQVWVGAYGEIRCNFPNGNQAVDKNNNGIFEQLIENGIHNDTELNAQDIEWANNNWFEFTIYDPKTQTYLTDNMDNVIDFDDIFSISNEDIDVLFAE